MNLVMQDCKSYLSNVFIGTTIFVAIATFGFEITHTAIGMDDFGLEQYFSFSSDSYGNMIQQGRLTHVLLYYLTGLTDFIPFLNPLLGVSLFVISSWFFTVLCQKTSGSHFSSLQLICASVLYLSYPIFAFKFIYDLDMIAFCLSYCLVPFALLQLMYFLDGHGKNHLIIAFVSIILAIGTYESFCALFVCEAILCALLMYIYQEKDIKAVLLFGAKCAAVLIVAFIINMTIVFFARIVTGNNAYPRDTLLGSISSIFDESDGFLSAIKSILVSIARPHYYKLFLANYLFTNTFLASCAILFVWSAVHSIKRHNAWCLLAICLCLLFSISISVLLGALYYRTCQCFVIIVYAAALVLLDYLFTKKVLKIIALCGVGLLLVGQLKCINGFFYQDWINYQKNVYAINTIATDLIANYDVDKPVCFVNRDYDSFLETWDKGRQEEIGESALIASIEFLGNKTDAATRYLFEKQGYDFLVAPTVEQTQEAHELSSEMNAYPAEGYILETDEIIVVNFCVNN